METIKYEFNFGNGNVHGHVNSNNLGHGHQNYDGYNQGPTSTWNSPSLNPDCNPTTSVPGTTVAPTTTIAPKHDKIVICHATHSESNPYVRISVDQDAADGNLGNDNGRGDHYAEHANDIIPPIPGVHIGLNWNQNGRGIWLKGCKIDKPVETTTTSTSTSTTSVPKTTSTSTSTTSTTIKAPTTTEATTSTVAETTTTQPVVGLIPPESIVREVTTSTTEAKVSVPASPKQFAETGASSDFLATAAVVIAGAGAIVLRLKKRLA